MNRNDSSTALITGASSGLGAEFARQLSARGFGFVLVARREERLVELARELESQSGASAEVLVADLSTQSGIEKVVNRIKEITNLEILVNNAGFGLSGKFTQAGIDEHLTMIRLHIIASVSLTYAVLPGMLARKSGTIINVSSLAGLFPLRNVTYGSTKAYLIHFSRTLDRELKSHGIKIQALCPGYILTEFHEAGRVSKERRSQIPKFMWNTTDQVVTESLDSINRGKVICVPGTIYRLIAILGTNPITYHLVYRLAVGIFRRRKQ